MDRVCHRPRRAVVANFALAPKHYTPQLSNFIALTSLLGLSMVLACADDSSSGLVEEVGEDIGTTKSGDGDGDSETGETHGTGDSDGGARVGRRRASVGERQVDTQKRHHVVAL